MSLVLNDKKLLGPLSEGLKAFERVNRAAQETQERVTAVTEGLKGAASAARSLAASMERVARASGSFTPPGNAPGAGPSPARSWSMPGPFYPPAVSGGGGDTPPPPPGYTPNFTMRGGAGGGAGGMPPLLGYGGMPLNFNAGSPSYPGVNWGAAGGLLYKGLAAAQVVEMVVGGIGHLIDKAKGLNDQLVVLQQRGVSPQQANDFESIAFDLSRKIPGRDISRIVSDAGNLRAVLGESDGSADPLGDVKAMLPQVEKTGAALSAVTGQDSDSAMHMLLRAIELRGGLIDPETHKISPTRFAKELETIYKVLVSGGGMISPNDMLNVMQQAGPMARMSDADTFYGTMMTAILDMKGNRAGTSLTAAGRQVFGGRMSKAFAEEMGSLGLIDQDGWESNGAGYITLKPQAQKKLTDSMQGGLFDWVQKVLRPALVTHGFETDAAQNQELYKLFSTETFRRLAALFLQNADQVLRDRKLFPEVLPPDKALERAMKGDIGFNLDALQTSFLNFLQSVEKVNAPGIISVLSAFRDALDFLTGWEGKQDDFKQKLDKSGALGTDPWWKHSPMSRYFWFGDTDSLTHKESYVRPNTSGPRIQTISYIQLDGRTIAKAVSEEQAKYLSRPQSGTSWFDRTMTAASPGQQVLT